MATVVTLAGTGHAAVAESHAVYDVRTKAARGFGELTVCLYDTEIVEEPLVHETCNVIPITA
ncbi:hypothetical protein GCM10010344_39150 [Streptomyces bluensis]|nr:hypothetical protein GCM10010344_39150 [Streptomyces bluensis]